MLQPNVLPLRPGLVIGEYRLDALLKADIGDAAWRGQNLPDQAVVRLDVFQSTPATSPLTRAAFKLAKLPIHPHLLPLLDVLTMSELTITVSPHLPVSLADRPRPLAPEEAVRIIQQLLAALQVLHEHGQVHGQLAPGYVALENDQVRLRGYGFSQFRPRLEENLPYVSPYVLEAPPTPQDDLWSVGVMLFELLSGDLPFSHQNQNDLRLAIQTLYADPLPHHFPAHLRHIVARALERDRRRQYATAQQMAEDLAACAEERSVETAARTSSPSLPPLSAAPVTFPALRPTGRLALLVIALMSFLMLAGIWLTIRYFESKDLWRMTPQETVVAPAGGDFTTITAAVTAARTGARILIRPGVYRETVVLTKNVELAADALAGKAIIMSDGAPCLRQSLGSQVVRGLTLESQHAPAVQLDGGALTIEDSQITATAGDSLRVQGPETRLVLRHSRLHNGAGNGLTAGDTAQLELVECDIVGHRGDGLRLTGQARLKAYDCRITDNQQVGVQALERATAQLERCTLERNGQNTRGNVNLGATARPTPRP
ncbi:MAG: serine/threonine protein kinase [Acidobacteriota bacterium]